MRSLRFLMAVFVGAAIASGARDAGNVEQAAARVERLATPLTPTLRLEFRMLAAQALNDRYPQLAGKFARATLEEVRSRDTIDPQIMRALVAIAPEETIALLPHLKEDRTWLVIEALIQANQAPRAAALYRASWKHSQLDVMLRGAWGASPLLTGLSKQNPDEARKLFAAMLAAFSFETASSVDLLGMVYCAAAVAPVAPELAADAYEHIVARASAPGYEKNLFRSTFQIGSATITLTNARDVLLVEAGSRLYAVAPDRFEKHKDVLSQWDLASPVTPRPPPGAAPNQPTLPPAQLAISERVEQLRTHPDAQHSQALIELAHAVQALPKGSKSGWAASIAYFATEGDTSREALNAVAAALGQSIHEGAPSARAYLQLASLVRYEHARAPFSDPSLDAANAVLALRESVYRKAGFALTSVDGKTYSLGALRGKIVLVNFWATWCVPCRKELPDMETLHRQFEKKGLVVLAVSDEDRETVAGFLEKEHYTFPALLDPGRKVTNAFGVESIPKSFIFNAKGKLVAQSVDMRTERQFLELLKQAGLE